MSIHEFSNTLQNKKDNSPSHDNITYSMIKHLPQNIKVMLVKLFNDFSKNNNFPSSWTTQRVIVVPKPNKELNLASSYRPIALSSCIEKIFETIIKH